MLWQGRCLEVVESAVAGALGVAYVGVVARVCVVARAGVAAGVKNDDCVGWCGPGSCRGEQYDGPNQQGQRRSRSCFLHKCSPFVTLVSRVVTRSRAPVTRACRSCFADAFSVVLTVVCARFFGTRLC